MRYLVSGATKTVSSLLGRYRDYLGALTVPRAWNSLESIRQLVIPWAIDNGAYSGFDKDAFTRLINRAADHKENLLFVVCPDRVGNAHLTLRLFDHWQPVLTRLGLPIAFVLQDGQTLKSVPPADWYFIGGTTEWKFSSHVIGICEDLREQGKPIHMGRVNSLKRLRFAHELGCQTVDGSRASRWPDKYLCKAVNWLANIDEQQLLFSGENNVR